MVEVTFGTGNRITIPKSVADELAIPQGTKLQLEIKENTIILKPVNGMVLEKIKEIKGVEKVEKPKTTQTVVQPKSKSKKNIKIVSNLVEGQSFKTKYYSKCGLVIRTKNRYLKDFCEACQGQLLQQHTSLTKRDCPYCKNTPKQNIIQTLTDNAMKLDKMLDNQIKDIEEKDKPIKKLNKKLNKDKIKKLNKIKGTVIIPCKTQDDNVKVCNHCKLYFHRGFLLNNTFYCKDCAKEHFKMFLKTYKDYKEKGLV